jgi:2-dehydro-3-deoxyphosphogluconate aldolase/(4S)-4-hydroxy-2-oxoglutarate aldolase
MNEILKKIGEIGIIPVIKIEDIENAVPLAKALIDGGIPVAEVTFRAAGADKAIKAITEAFPEMLVGAGTVLNINQVKSAVEAGAKFIVSPGYNPKTVAYCVEAGIPVTPGCTTASEIEIALEAGLDVLKFFPAEQSGGIAKIKALSGPFSGIKFIPTGGIDLTNLNDYLSFNKVLACGGSFMVKEDYIKNKEWNKITELSAQAVKIMLGYELAHIGINCENSAEAEKAVKALCKLFGFSSRITGSGSFVEDSIELLNTPYLGKFGHIAIRTNNIVRAVAHSESIGFEINKDNLKYDAKGNMTAAYFSEEIAGFAFHLLQKK